VLELQLRLQQLQSPRGLIKSAVRLLVDPWLGGVGVHALRSLSRCVSPTPASSTQVPVVPSAR
jgi:hypothetical protein